MTTRDDLVEAGAHAICEQYVPSTVIDDDMRKDIGVVVDAVEPFIRADERESVKAEYVPVLMEHLRILADLRAKVEALPQVGSYYGRPVVPLADVLDLLDGGAGHG